MKQLGKGLQLLALILAPAGMIMEINGSLGRSFGLSQLLIVMVFALVLFYFGRMLEGYSR